MQRLCLLKRKASNSVLFSSGSILLAFERAPSGMAREQKFQAVPRGLRGFSRWEKITFLSRGPAAFIPGRRNEVMRKFD